VRNGGSDVLFRRKSRGRRVIIAGLDCAAPQLIFERWRDSLPTFRTLMEQGAYGPLTSTIPAITVPAWSSMFSGKDPGTLGFYGFRNRANYTYHQMTIATSGAVKEPRIWDLAGNAGLQTVLVGVPQTYPVSAVNGHLVSDFLTPSTVRNQYTFPESLKGEIEALLGHPYRVDVDNFRTDDKDDLLQRIWDVTEEHFRVVHYLMREKPWDLFAFVEIGVDRMHHGFWKYHDSKHPKYERGNRFEDATLDYYRYLDEQVKHILDVMDDDTVLLVVSDHGAQAMEGGFCINEWLRERGYLVLKEEPEGDGLVPFERVEVDWQKTRAWGAGGYYGRLFINVAGREPSGVVSPDEYEGFREELIGELTSTTGPDGRPLGTVCYKPEDIYRRVHNIPPDVIVYFGNLRWRSVGSFGHGGVYTFENDVGPDDANHAQDGLVMVYDPRTSLRGARLHAQCMDIAPTVLRLMGLPVPEDVQGKVIAL